MAGQEWALVLVDDMFNTCGLALAWAIHVKQGTPLGAFSTTTLYAPASVAAGLPFHPLLMHSANSPFQLRPRQSDLIVQLPTSADNLPL